MPVSQIIGMLSVYRLKWLKNVWHCVKYEKTVGYQRPRKTQIYWESYQHCSFTLVLLKGCIESVYVCSSCFVVMTAFLLACWTCWMVVLCQYVICVMRLSCIYCVPTTDMCHAMCFLPACPWHAFVLWICASVYWHLSRLDVSLFLSLLDLLNLFITGFILYLGLVQTLTGEMLWQHRHELNCCLAITRGISSWFTSLYWGT